MKKIIAIVCLVLLLLASVVFSVSQLRPSEFTTVTSTSVNFSLNYNQTTNGATLFNVAVYNSSASSTGPFQKLVDFNYTNSSFFNRTITLKDNERHWWYVNVTNATGGADVSAVRVFDVDTGFLKFQFGGYSAFNITVDSGNTQIANNLSTNILNLRNSTADTTLDTCTASNAGAIRYNGTFWGCTGAATWKQLDN